MIRIFADGAVLVMRTSGRTHTRLVVPPDQAAFVAWSPAGTGNWQGHQWVEWRGSTSLTVKAPGSALTTTTQATNTSPWGASGSSDDLVARVPTALPDLVKHSGLQVQQRRGQELKLPFGHLVSALPARFVDSNGLGQAVLFDRKGNPRSRAVAAAMVLEIEDSSSLVVGDLAVGPGTGDFDVWIRGVGDEPPSDPPYYVRVLDHVEAAHSCFDLSKGFLKWYYHLSEPKVVGTYVRPPASPTELEWAKREPAILVANVFCPPPTYP